MFFSNFKKKVKILSQKEPILLFSVFFLPGFLNQNRIVDPGTFNSPRFNFFYLITVIPQMLLLLYLINKKGKGSLSKYGITPLIRDDFWKAILYFVSVMMLMILSGIVLFFLSKLAGYDYMASLPGWKITDKRIIPLIFLTCLAGGYSEELFFRSYLLTEFVLESRDKIPVAVAVSILFASGHIYQGPGAFVSTFLTGLFFSFIFLKKRRIHSIAIGHALYNFAVLAFSLLPGSP